MSVKGVVAAVFLLAWLNLSCGGAQAKPVRAGSFAARTAVASGVMLPRHTASPQTVRPGRNRDYTYHRGSADSWLPYWAFGTMYFMMFNNVNQPQGMTRGADGEKTNAIRQMNLRRMELSLRALAPELYDVKKGENDAFERQ